MAGRAMAQINALSMRHDGGVIGICEMPAAGSRGTQNERRGEGRNAEGCCDEDTKDRSAPHDAMPFFPRQSLAGGLSRKHADRRHHAGVLMAEDVAMIDKVPDIHA